MAVQDGVFTWHVNLAYMPPIHTLLVPASITLVCPALVLADLSQLRSARVGEDHKRKRGESCGEDENQEEHAHRSVTLPVYMPVPAPR